MPRGAAVVRYDGKRGVVWRIKYRDADGRQIMETLGREIDGWTRAQADAELRERLVKVDKHRYRRPKLVLFSEYANEWLAEREARGAIRPSTAASYRNALRHLKATFGDDALGEIRTRDVNRYIAERSRGSAKTPALGPGTIHIHLVALGMILSQAMAEEIIDRNPVENCTRPKPSDPHWRILEPAEIAAVDQALTDPTHRLAFRMLVILGPRRNELLELRWRDVDLVNGTIHVRTSKTTAGVRAIACPPLIHDGLVAHYAQTAYKADDDRVLCHPLLGSAMLEKEWRKAFRAALETAGVEGRVRAFHDLRHTSITQDALSGASPIALMARAGHSSMRVTQTYLHLADRVFREEAQQLERRLFGEAEKSARVER